MYSWLIFSNITGGAHLVYSPGFLAQEEEENEWRAQNYQATKIQVGPLMSLDHRISDSWVITCSPHTSILFVHPVYEDR